MFIVPTVIEQQINRVDPQHSRLIGIGCAVVAGWCAFRLVWLLYIAITFGWAFGALVFSFVLWGVIGVSAAIAAIGLLNRDANQPPS